MGNFYMEATQINYRRDEKPKTVDQKLQELSQESAIDTDIAPVFKSTNTYQPGDLVYYRNKLYVFNVEHTGAWAAADVTATDVTSAMNAALAGKADYADLAGAFSAETAYTAGDLVIYNGIIYRCTNDHSGDWDADDFSATTISAELATLKSGLTNVNNGYLSKQFVVINGTSIYDFVRNTNTPTGYIVADVQGATDNPIQNATAFAVIYKPIANGNYSLVKIEKGGQLFISDILMPSDTAFTFTEFANKSDIITSDIDLIKTYDGTFNPSQASASIDKSIGVSGYYPVAAVASVKWYACTTSAVCYDNSHVMVKIQNSDTGSSSAKDVKIIVFYVKS